MTAASAGDHVLRVAAAQYAAQRLPDWTAYADRVAVRVAEAAGQGADLIVFPEYAGAEVVGLATDAERVAPRRDYPAAQSFLETFRELHAGLARTHGVAIVAGSLPVAGDGPRYRNRVHVFGPDGRESFQDKLQLTRFERSLGLMESGDGLRVFDLGSVRIGVTLCYDAQFPLLGRALARAGATVLVAPSCTDAATGYNRVRTACRARALENQCYVVQAASVGRAPWMPIMTASVGAAGVYAPPDRGFPDDGVVAVGDGDTESWLYAALDLDAVARVRERGEVANFGDWAAQERGLDAAVEQVALSAPGE